MVHSGKMFYNVECGKWKVELIIIWNVELDIKWNVELNIMWSQILLIPLTFGVLLWFLW